jgi:hypothetical protein
MSFKAVQKKIESQGHSAASAGAILASASRNASKKAKKANPNLKKVHGGSTLISADSMKGKNMTQDRKSNLAIKNGFAAGKQDGSKNIGADRAANKSMDQKFDAGTNDAVKDMAAGRASNKAIKNAFCDCSE